VYTYSKRGSSVRRREPEASASRSKSSPVSKLKVGNAREGERSGDSSSIAEGVIKGLLRGTGNGISLSSYCVKRQALRVARSNRAR